METRISDEAWEFLMPREQPSDTYRWVLDGTTLTFSALTPDPCGRVGVLDGVTYQRAD